MSHLELHRLDYYHEKEAWKPIAVFLSIAGFFILLLINPLWAFIVLGILFIAFTVWMRVCLERYTYRALGKAKRNGLKSLSDLELYVLYKGR